MKLLIVGIDGGDERFIRALPMPNLHKWLDSYTHFPVTEDLWSRGWAEILSGRHGRETGAFYTKPIPGNSGQFTQSFKGDDYARDAKTLPLWEVAKAAGLKFGMMNIPTTMPAPQVNGFVVSGAGGGFSGSGSAEIPAVAVHPADIRDQLYAHEYIFDTRFRASGIRQWDELLTRLHRMQNKRVEVFAELCNTHQIDVGFVAFMSTKCIQYLAVSEIESIIANGVQNERQQAIVDLYSDFDSRLGELIATLDPRYLLFVSDHGAAPYRYNVNVHAFLRQCGMLGQPQRSKSLVRQIGRIVPRSLKLRMTKAAPQAVKAVRAPNIDYSNARAFGSRYIPGIYLNDARFGGVVKADAAPALLQEIISAFNNNAAAQQHKLHARPYRQHYPEAAQNALLPDIWIDHADDYFFTAHGDFITPNNEYGPLPSLAEVPRDQYTGIKGRHPLLFTNAPVSADGPDDLTQAYRLIKQIIELQ